jgi:hypothetical protein
MSTEAVFSVGKLVRHISRGVIVAIAGFLLTAGNAPSAREQQPSGLPARVDPKAQELIGKTIQALGGQAFLSFKTMTTRGRAFAIREGSTAGLAPYESWVEYPEKRRFSYGKSKPVILINNGDKAWELDRYGLTSQLPEQVRRWQISNRFSLENLLRLRIHDPGVLIQMGGADFVDNVPTQGIDITEAGGTSVRLDLHRRTFLPIRIRYRVQNAKTHEWEEYEDVYADYRLIQGIQTAMHITRYIEGERVAETFRSSAQYNEDYPADYFQPTN